MVFTCMQNATDASVAAAALNIFESNSITSDNFVLIRGALLVIVV